MHTLNVYVFTVAFLLIGTWSFNCGVIFQAYINLTFDIILTWIKNMDYWTIQDSAYEICHDKNVLVWSDVTDDNINLPFTCSLLLHLVYLCVRPAALIRRWKETGLSLVYGALISTLIPKVLICLDIFPVFMSELSYWIDNILLIIIGLSEVVTLMDIDTKRDEKKLSLLKLKYEHALNNEIRLKYKLDIEHLHRRMVRKNFADRFPGKWFIRDTVLLFGICYLFIVILIEVTVYQRSAMSMVTSSALLEMFTKWCTTYVIVMFISYCFSLISYLTVALNYWFLTNERNIPEAFIANTGGTVQYVVVITFIEANVLSLDNNEKLEVMNLVAFLSIYAIILHTLDVLEQKILQAVNSVNSPEILFYIRAFILSGILFTIPSLSTLILAKSLAISPWLLFFASGNSTLAFSTIGVVVECALIKATWYTTNHLTKLEDVLHYTRACKTLVFVILNCVQCYCRYACPFFKGWWLLRLSLSLFNFIAVAGVLGLNEFNRYKTRNRMLTLLKSLQDVSFHNDNVTTECAICYLEMTKAKMLPCKHVFHNDCLRKWFQVRSVCPMCNTDIKA